MWYVVEGGGDGMTDVEVQWYSHCEKYAQELFGLHMEGCVLDHLASCKLAAGRDLAS